MPVKNETDLDVATPLLRKFCIAYNYKDMATTLLTGMLRSSLIFVEIIWK